MKKLLSQFGSIVLILVFLLVIAQITSVIAAVNPGGIGGWAWSSNTGWLSASSTDAGAGGGPYQLVADGSGNITGYMWSSNLGWIKFGGLASFPAAGGNANVNLTNGAVTGWARACAGAVFGTCASMISRSDGWDGWIELSGTNHATSDMSGNGGVTMDSTTGAFVGYAWGGSVMGWIQFNTAGAGSTGVTLCPLGNCANQPITGNCTAVPNPPTNLAPNTAVTFTANPTSGTGPYTYNWDGAGYAGSNTKIVSYSSTGSGPNVLIKDSIGAFSNSISCPVVTILQPLGSTNLLIAKSGTTATKNTATLNKNTQFFLSFNATMSSDYTCAPESGTNWDGSGWLAMPINNVSNGDGTDTWSGTTAALDSGTVVGTYNFTVACNSGTNPQQSSSATLRVVSTAINEI
ncbi:MAG: hypothetical protein WCV82_01280 [Candidatus Paceibacterota bacterium]